MHDRAGLTKVIRDEPVRSKGVVVDGGRQELAAWLEIEGSSEWGELKVVQHRAQRDRMHGNPFRKRARGVLSKVIRAFPAVPVATGYTLLTPRAHQAALPHDPRGADVRILVFKGRQQVWNQTVMGLYVEVFGTPPVQKVLLKGQLFGGICTPKGPEAGTILVQADPAFLVDLNAFHLADRTASDVRRRQALGIGEGQGRSFFSPPALLRQIELLEAHSDCQSVVELLAPDQYDSKEGHDVVRVWDFSPQSGILGP